MKEKKQFISGFVAGIFLIVAICIIIKGASILHKGFFTTTLTPDKKINEILNVIDTHYANKYDVKELEENMYRGLVDGLEDPYSVYMDKEVFEGFMQNTEGTYKGIGVVVTSDKNDNSLVIVTAFKGAPGEKAGLVAGDKIKKINGLDMKSTNLKDATDMIKGAAGTTVHLTIYRESENRDFDLDILREDVDIPTVSHEMINNEIGYLKIATFDRVTYDQFMDAYNDLLKNGMKKMVIDLRNNPGGLLDTVIKITDQLVPEGIITYTEDKDGKRRYANSDPQDINIPLVILVNGNSASASEVLTGAVKDYGVAKVVGTQTYGKGVVQNIYKLTDGSGVKVTIAKYYTPKGVCIDGKGIAPDYVVDVSEEEAFKVSSLGYDKDIQLQKAVEVLGQ